MRLSAVILLSVLAGVSSALETKSDEGALIFARHVYPMLQAKCLACHGEDPKKIKGDLWLTTREGMLTGGENGTALVPGKPERSPLYVAVTWSDPELEMPPKENDRLSPEQIAALRRWIELGAPWVGEAERLALQASAPQAAGRVVLTSVGGQSSDWAARGYKSEDLWSFRPLGKEAPPAESAQPLDWFIERDLAQRNVVPLGDADRLTLIRRASYDLTGLPPTPAEVDAFRSDTRPDAWERLIDTLLASPRYGEKWASHWLDVVRYADSSGFANDYPRPNAWRYRDYVVRSFNADKPYDRFVREQLAGDEIDAEDPELLIATGFLRMGSWEHTSMSVASLTRQLFLDDVTNSVGLSFLGHELRCAQCHDHKFDPIPTRDYYRIQAAFAPTQFADRAAAWLAAENRDGMAAERARLERLRSEAGSVRSLETIPAENRPVQEWDRDAEKGGHDRVNKKRRDYIAFDLRLTEPFAFAVYNGPTRVLDSAKHDQAVPGATELAKPVDDVRILKGGSLESATDLVEPGTLAAVEAMRGASDPVVTSALPGGRDGRRLALAEWIVSRDNPLTARVMVNRIWLHHFGRGLAANPNNLGAMGAKPTHPALLDWLARRFMDEGWSVKAMHRLIMTSAAYRRAGGAPQEAVEGDSYARFQPRRLTAEELRDSMLMLSGELNLAMGGLPARPELNLEVAMQPRQIMGGIAMAYQPHPLPTQRHRRTIYTQRIRTLRDPMLEVFNQPNIDLSAEARDASTITPQAFTLFNSRQSQDRAIAMALRLQREYAESPAQIAGAFRLAYGRSPSAVEHQAVVAHLAAQEARHRTQQPTRMAPPTWITREMVDEKTGVTFWWVEDLDIYRDSYVPDRTASDVDAATRALADVCLVLMNSNEFVYVY